LIEAAIKNIELSIEQKTEFGPVETIEISLSYENEIISTSYCSLPENREER